MPIPTLTFQQRSLVNVSGSPDGKTVLVAIRDHILAAAAPAWNIQVTTDGTGHLSGGVQAPYLEIGFAANIGDHPCKVLLACSDDPGAAPQTANVYDNGASLRYDANKAPGQLYIGLAQRGAGLGGADPFGGATLYGGGDDWTGFCRLVEDLPSVKSFWIVDSEEVSGIFFEGASGEIFGCMFGAVVEPLTDLAGSRVDSGGDGRCFGFFSFGPNDVGLQNYLHSNATSDAFLSHALNAAAGQLDHNAWGLVYDIARGLTPVGAIRGPNGDASTVSPTYPNGALRDAIGNLAALPLLVCTASGSSVFDPTPHLVGVLRQMKICENSKCRTPITDNTGTIVGFAVSGSLVDNLTSVMISQS